MRHINNEHISTFNLLFYIFFFSSSVIKQLNYIQRNCKILGKGPHLIIRLQGCSNSGGSLQNVFRFGSSLQVEIPHWQWPQRAIETRYRLCSSNAMVTSKKQTITFLITLALRNTGLNLSYRKSQGRVPQGSAQRSILYIVHDINCFVQLSGDLYLIDILELELQRKLVLDINVIILAIIYSKL